MIYACKGIDVDIRLFIKVKFGLQLIFSCFLVWF